MPLLDAMPLVWCAVLAFALLWLIFCEKTYALIVASMVSLALSASGIPPWLQVVLWCAVGLIFRVFCASNKHEKKVAYQCAAVFSRDNDGWSGMVLYHGKYYTASPGCDFARMPPCGAVVQVLICNNGHCMICPQ